MQSHCDGLISKAPSTPTFHFPPNPSSSSSSSSTSSYFSAYCISFPSKNPPIFSALKARATLNNEGRSSFAKVKPVSEMTFYELLGIPESESLPKIKQAYKQLVRVYHPDVCPHPELVREYTERFIRVQEAYETLSDPRTRAIYDHDLARGLHLHLHPSYSSRKTKIHNSHHQEMEDKDNWRVRWQSQLSELKKRSMSTDAKKNSWGARMRRMSKE